MNIGSSGLLTWPLDIGAGGALAVTMCKDLAMLSRALVCTLWDNLNPSHDDLKHVMSQKPPMSTKPRRREGKLIESMFMFTRPYWLVL